MNTPPRSRTLPLVLSALLVLGSGVAVAQTPEARLVLSADDDEFVSEIAVANLVEEFTLYVMVTAMPDEAKVNFDASRFSWAILEACCGSSLLLQDIRFNPAWEHEGNPFGGVVSHSEICLSDDYYVLAEVDLAIDAPEPGAYEAGLIPLDTAVDCDNGDRMLMGWGTTIHVGGVANDENSWSAVKAKYR